MIKTKVAFLEGPLLSGQSEQSEKLSKKLWLAGKRPALQISHFCFDHVNRLNISLWRSQKFWLQGRRGPKRKNFVTLFWWRHLADVMVVTYKNDDITDFLKFDFVLISLKKHNLVKSPNFRLLILKN